MFDRKAASRLIRDRAVQTLVDGGCTPEEARNLVGDAVRIGAERRERVYTPLAEREIPERGTE